MLYGSPNEQFAFSCGFYANNCMRMIIPFGNAHGAVAPCISGVPMIFAPISNPAFTARECICFAKKI